MTGQKILLLISSILFVTACVLYYYIRKRKVNLDQLEQKKKQIQLDIQRLNVQLKQQTEDLKIVKDSIVASNSEIKYINNTINEKQQEHKKLLKQIQNLKQQSNNFYNQQKAIVEKQLEEFKKISSKAAENYFDNLQEAYKAADAAHAEKLTRLKEEQNSAAAALVQLKETRKAAYEAILKEQEIKQNKDNYRLIPSQKDLQDIHSLEKVKQILNKPRVLAMLIWQSFWQPIAKKKFPIILQDKTKMGIYKITNLMTDQCYIGQSTDIYTRWCTHCKAGLGIDTPVGNKLYKAIQEYGLQNFTFELLCQCSKQELDAKEKYFIELYQADLYGYNGTKGNK